ncbi:transcriptional regulator GcvA [Maribrevibacterium harenarium]|uniref:transcriptional regulator GcvA n=1 Tax=Maribrevibacterium harenarium TaxID=2589817 RepID=UPI002E269170
MRLPPLNTLRCFEAAARHGSFNRAAQELHVTPSAVSHQIKALEEHLGVELFRRAKRKVVLTPAGESYVVPVQDAFALLERATTDIQASQQISTLKLAVAPAFLTRWLMPRMESFQQQYPDIEIEIASATGMIDFAASDIDMAVYYGTGQWQGVEKHFLRPIRLAPVCSPKLIRRDVPIEKPEDMRFYPLLHVSKRRDEWHDWLAQNDLDPTVFRRGLMFSSGSLTAGAAVQGLGIALADAELVQAELEAGSLIKLFDTQLATNRSFYLVYEKRRPVTAAMAAFREWIMAQMQPDESAAS